MKSVILAVLMLAVLVLNACAPTPGAQLTPSPEVTPEVTEEMPTGEPTAEPTEEPTEPVEPTDEVPTPQDGGDPTPAAARAAVAALAELLGIGENEITIESIEDAEFSDACLGAGQPDEGCLQVITPGFIVRLVGAGMTYIYHTDREGSTVRLAATEPSVAQPVEMPGAVVGAVIRLLASEFNLAEEEIQVVDTRQVSWTEGCFDESGASIVCMATRTNAGYLLEVQARDQTCFAHTDAERINPNFICGVTAEAEEQVQALSAAILYLGKQLVDVSPQDIQVESVEAVEWTDSCLGVPHPDALCAQVLTPGYNIMLSNGERSYEVHTDSDGFNIALAPDEQ